MKFSYKALQCAMDSVQVKSCSGLWAVRLLTMTQHRERLLSFSLVASILMAFYCIYLVGSIYTLFQFTLLIQIICYIIFDSNENLADTDKEIIF